MNDLPEIEPGIRVTKDGLVFLREFKKLNDEQKEIIREKMRKMAQKSQEKNKE